MNIFKIFQKKVSEVFVDKDAELIKTTPYQTLAVWYRLLNSWQWPVELLPEEKPEDRNSGRRGKIMALITIKVGEKYLLRHHNRYRMNEEEFEDFWQGTKCGDTEAYERYIHGLKQRCIK